MRIFAWLPLACAMLLGCSNQAEGERCDLDNGNADCESGLICKSLQSLSGQGEGAICCPDGTPSVAACKVGNFDVGDDDVPADPDDEPDAPTDDDADDMAGDDAADAAAEDAAAPADAGEQPADSGTANSSPAADSGTSDAGE